MPVRVVFFESEGHEAVRHGRGIELYIANAFVYGPRLPPFDTDEITAFASPSSFCVTRWDDLDLWTAAEWLEPTLLVREADNHRTPEGPMHTDEAALAFLATQRTAQFPLRFQPID